MKPKASSKKDFKDLKILTLKALKDFLKHCQHQHHCHKTLICVKLGSLLRGVARIAWGGAFDVDLIQTVFIDSLSSC